MKTIVYKNNQRRHGIPKSVICLVDESDSEVSLLEYFLLEPRLEICDFDEVTNSVSRNHTSSDFDIVPCRVSIPTTAILNLTSITICQICPAVKQLGGA